MIQSISSARIDHVVINVRYEMDRAQDRFSRFGFALTERGYHSLGSINHLAMFESDYLELIGLPVAAGTAPITRAGVSDAPHGINGLVFKTDNADAVFDHLQAIGLAAQPPVAFSRPVTIDGKQFDARFRTVHVRPNAMVAGRIYFCEHATPELVWRDSLQQHANGATSIEKVVVVAEDTSAVAQQFALLLATESQASADQSLVIPCQNAQIEVTSRTEYQRRYRELATEAGTRDSFFGAISLRTDALDRVVEWATRHELLFRREANRLVLREPEFDSVIEFVL